MARRASKNIRKLLFVDSNIWLDFYRARTEAGLGLLQHLDAISDKIIVTYQLEMEVKKNRQTAILEGMNQIKSPESVSRPGLFSDAKAVKVIQKNMKTIDGKIKTIKSKYNKVLENPTLNDPVYKVYQRIFHREDRELILSLDDPRRKLIRSKALRRFLHGCPPRKKNDTSMGDSINWEWLVYCAEKQKAELVIVTRDSDYGVTLGDRSYLNDHLRHEFSDRVSQQRKVHLYSKLSDALKHFEVAVTPEEVEEEEVLIQEVRKEEPTKASSSPGFETLLKALADASGTANGKPMTVGQLFTEWTNQIKKGQGQ
ncbi:MAG: DUF4935 domain-containing protein [Bdellovibrionales bacterium]|nr:DUF4935 domain-containing protein [Bdellovibrionales bacterium]